MKIEETEEKIIYGISNFI